MIVKETSGLAGGWNTALRVEDRCVTPGEGRGQGGTRIWFGKMATMMRQIPSRAGRSGGTLRSAEVQLIALVFGSYADSSVIFRGLTDLGLGMISVAPSRGVDLDVLRRHGSCIDDRSL